MARQDGAKRRVQIIEIAQSLFYTKGYESTSVNDIINTAGVSKGAFYHHFDSKQAVMTAVIDGLVEQTYELIQPILDNDEFDALEKFKRIIYTANNWKIEQRDQMLAIIKVLYSDGNLRLRHQLLAETSRATMPIWTQIIKQGVAEGIFHLDGVDEAHTAEFILALLRNSSETFINHLLDPNQSADVVAIVTNKYASAQTTVERMLGAPLGSLPLIEQNDIAAWFA